MLIVLVLAMCVCGLVYGRRYFRCLLICIIILNVVCVDYVHAVVVMRINVLRMVDLLLLCEKPI